MTPPTKYNLMWMMVLFDLPVGTKKQRRAAAGFRNFLLDLGFEMEQFSVYLRFCGDRQKTWPLVKKIKAQLPPDGQISLLFFTDKQFGEAINFHNREERRRRAKPEQLTIF